MLNDFFALKILLICLNKSALCQSILKSKYLCQKKNLDNHFQHKKQQDYAITIRTYLKQDQNAQIIFLMEKNYFLGIFK